MGGSEVDAVSGVTWLLVDIGGVLEVVDDEVWPSRFATRWEARLGLSAGTYWDRLGDADLPDATTRWGVGEDYWRLSGEALGATTEQLSTMRAGFWDEYCGVINEELLAVFSALHGRVGLAILSNSGDGAREEEERRFGFSRLFDPICYSHEIGVLKPAPAAFEIALEAMSATPPEVLFIDNWPENIDAARRLGFRAHLHLENSTTIAAIKHAVAGT